MRKAVSILIIYLCCGLDAIAGYVDHRGHNVDSLETVMSGWTAGELAHADEAELKAVAMDLEELMYGFSQTSPVKSEYYARILLGVSQRMRWRHYEQLAAKNIGQHFWVREKYDSAAFYYGVALNAVDMMSTVDTLAVSGDKYSQDTIDDAMSQMYGTLGNLYSEMDSIDVAMEYYEKAGELFKKHEWHNSNSVLYYNMGETMRGVNEYKKAEEYYLESLKYSKLAEDSLAVATAYKGLGSLYLDTHRTAKAMRYLAEANNYFADHEDEELQFRMESLDYTEQVRTLQNKRLTAIIVLLVAFILMSAAAMYAMKRLRRVTRENKELDEVLEGTVEGISPLPDGKDSNLKPKEKEVLDLIAKGYTNVEIAEAMSLSPETIKWYKKKLFAMFDASNSAELIKVVKDKGIL